MLGIPGRIRICFLAVLVLCSLLLVTDNAAADSKDEFKQAVIEVLKEHPDLILDILRDNSEVVLDIARLGNLHQQLKVFRERWKEDAAVPKKLALENIPLRGEEKAPVVIVGFTDFLCPHCQRAELVLKDLLKKYTGKVRFYFKPLPKDKQELSQTAAKYCLAAFEQSTEKAWQLYDSLFENAEQLEKDGLPFLDALVVKADLDPKRTKADAASPKFQTMLDSNNREADALNIEGTPYFIVNNLIIRGYVPKEVFEEAIRIAMKDKAKAPKGKP